MPPTALAFYCELDGSCPVRDWLADLQRQNRRAFAKCVARLRRLAVAGYELRRPEADLLRDGIYELRARDGHVQYRILYFFHGRNVAILAHGLTKEDQVPHAEIQRSIRRKEAFQRTPQDHTLPEAPGF